MVFIDIHFYEDIKKICFSRKVKGGITRKISIEEGEDYSWMGGGRAPQKFF